MDQRLIDYIKQNKEKRGSDEEIKKTLLDAGWKEGDIEEGFRTVTESKQPIVPEESVKKLKPKWLVPVIIVVGIIVLGLITWGGYELFKPAPSKLPGAGEIEQDQFKNWKTYRNEEYGFEIKYPERWLVEVKDNPPKPLGCVQRIYLRKDIGSAGVDILIFANPLKSSIREWLSQQGAEDSFEGISLNTIPALKSDKSDSGSYFLYVARGNYIYMIDVVKFSDKTIVDIQNQILSTFKFIEKAQTLSPKEAYLKMKAEFDNIKIYDDLEAFTLKYGSKNQIAELEANREKINALPQSFKDQIVASMKSLSPSSKEITTIEETISGNTATLNVQSTKPGLKGTVTLVLEDNQWKLELESWKQ
jgi:hypothetical protein